MEKATGYEPCVGWVINPAKTAPRERIVEGARRCHSKGRNSGTKFTHKKFGFVPEKDGGIVSKSAWATQQQKAARKMPVKISRGKTYLPLKNLATRSHRFPIHGGQTKSPHQSKLGILSKQAFPENP